MDDIARRFREEAEQSFDVSKQRSRYPEKLKLLAMEYIKLATVHGDSARAISRALGITFATVQSWQLEAFSDDGQRTGREHTAARADAVAGAGL